DKHLIKQSVKTPVPAVNSGSVEVGEATVVVPKTSLVITDYAPVARQAVRLIANFADREDRSVHREIRAVMIVVADGRVSIVNAAHNVGPLSRSYFDEGPPSVIGISCHTGRVEKNGYRISIKPVLNEEIIVARYQEVVPSGDSAKSEFDTIVKE